jgi:ankyrin repeat protein
MKSLATRGCNVNSADGRGWTPLHLAAFTGGEQGGGVLSLLVELGEEREKTYGGGGSHKKNEPKHDRVSQLLQMNPKDNRGWTPLMCAASNGNHEFIRLLVNAQHADPMLVNREGRSALHIAASKGMERVCRVLIDEIGAGKGGHTKKKKEEPIAVDDEGEGEEGEEKEGGEEEGGEHHEHVVDNHPTPTNPHNNQHSSNSSSPLINLKSKREWTPLFEACLHNHQHVMKLLLKAGADSAVEDMLGNTAEAYAQEGVWSKIVGPADGGGGGRK